jgi:hypothetical protein
MCLGQSDACAEQIPATQSDMNVHAKFFFIIP